MRTPRRRRRTPSGGTNSNLLGLYRLGDRLAGKIHKVIFATPSLNLDGIHKVAQGELMGQGRREK